MVFPRALLGTVLLVFAAAVPRAQVVEPPAHHVDRIHVKLAEGSGAELRQGQLVSRTGVDLRRPAALFARAHAEPLFTALPWEGLDALHRQACACLPEGRRPGHLGLWFRLRTDGAAAATALLAALAAEPLVEHAYLEPIPYGAGVAMATGDLPPTTPDYTALQGAHQPNPVGHGLRLAHGMLGARGRNVGFRMIESSWILDHEDVSQLTAANFVGGVPPVDPTEANHGLSGTSLVIADRNEYGIVGVADEVDARFFAHNLNGGIENTMLLAMNNSAPGDVLMIVVMVLIPQLGPGAWLPLEFFQAAFDATLTVTASGRHVVVPAGNGSRSLDDPQLLHRFDRSFRDSGAILVGASDAGALARAQFSNWGARIDAHSWGNNVVIAGYGTLFFPNGDVRQAYAGNGTGTSSATPHIAGIVAAIQGAARRQTGQVLSNTQVLDLLHTHGVTTPDVIGRRPDLPAILTAIGAQDGLRAAQPDVPLGGTMAVTIDGPAGSIAALYASFGTLDLPIGFNRNVHLDIGNLIFLGAFLLPAGTAPWSWQVTNDPSLHGADVYFQALRVDGTSPWHLTNSCQVTIL